MPRRLTLISPTAKEVGADTLPHLILVAYRPARPANVEVAVVQCVVGTTAEVVDVLRLSVMLSVHPYSQEYCLRQGESSSLTFAASVKRQVVLKYHLRCDKLTLPVTYLFISDMEKRIMFILGLL